MTLQSFEFPRPDNGTTFETYCLKIIRHYFKLQSLQKYALSGHSQSGVDLFGVSEEGQRYGVQCKLRNRGEILTQKEVIQEIDKAKNFQPSLNRYLIATTAKRDPQLQRFAATVSKEHSSVGLFTVDVYSWDDLEEILKVTPDLVRDLYGWAISDSPTSRGDVHREIDEAFEWVRRGQAEVTLELLLGIKKRRWDQLSSREMYRVLANIGNARLAQQDNNGAAQAFIEAATHQPIDEDAKALQALGYLVAGDPEQAREMANALCRDHPGLARAHMIRIRTAPENISLDELIETVPIVVRSDSEVALALHDRAVAENRLQVAEKIIRESTKGSEPVWPLLRFALGATIQQQELDKARSSFDGLIVHDKARILEAAAIFSSILVGERESDELAVRCYLNRAICYRLVGELKLAREDFQRAYDIEPQEERVVIACAHSAYRDRDAPDEAIGILEKQEAAQPSLKIERLLAEILSGRGNRGDLERAAHLLESHLPRLGELTEKERAGTIEALASLYVQLGQGEKAATLLAEFPEDMLRPAYRAMVHGNILWRLGRVEEALVEAGIAKDAVSDSEVWDEVCRVALLLEQLGQYEDAFRLWRKVVLPEVVSKETDHLLYCARKAGEHSFVLMFCQQLRASGHYEMRSICHEVEILWQYEEYSEVRKVLLDYLGRFPDDKFARLRLTTLAMQQGWEDLVESDPAMLPAVEEVEAAEVGQEVVDVLRLGPSPMLAVDYSYSLYRRFPDRAAAQGALIASMLRPGSAGLTIVAPSRVELGTAVCYRELESEETHWVVIEDSPDSSMARGEYTSGHALVRAMLGKSVGDEFPISEHGVRNRTGAIVEIRDKRIYRAQESMKHWVEKFH